VLVVGDVILGGRGDGVGLRGRIGYAESDGSPLGRDMSCRDWLGAESEGILNEGVRPAGRATGRTYNVYRCTYGW
jgi:hypothetical protein